jgi:hypothetical protein
MKILRVRYLKCWQKWWLTEPIRKNKHNVYNKYKKDEKFNNKIVINYQSLLLELLKI